jgi:hypothetical protein
MSRKEYDLKSFSVITKIYVVCEDVEWYPTAIAAFVTEKQAKKFVKDFYKIYGYNDIHINEVWIPGEITNYV